MEYKKYGDTYLVRIDLNEEIMQSLKTVCERENIRLARVEALGAANHAVIGVYDLKAQAYHQEELGGFMEMLGINMIRF